MQKKKVYLFGDPYDGRDRHGENEGVHRIQDIYCNGRKTGTVELYITPSGMIGMTLKKS